MNAKRLVDPQLRLDRRRTLDRRAFLQVACAAVAGIVAARFAEPVAAAGEPVAGSEKTSPPPKGLRSARCPVTGERVSEEASLGYRGGRIYFSSAESVDKFTADPAKYQALANAQLVFTGQFQQMRCPLSGDALNPRLKLKVCGVDVWFSSVDGVKEARRAAVDRRTEMVFGLGFDAAFARKQDHAAGSPPSSGGSAESRWSCVVCGYAHTGASPPEKCPECGAPPDSFVRAG